MVKSTPKRQKSGNCSGNQKSKKKLTVDSNEDKISEALKNFLLNTGQPSHPVTTEGILKEEVNQYDINVVFLNGNVIWKWR